MSSRSFGVGQPAQDGLGLSPFCESPQDFASLGPPSESGDRGSHSSVTPNPCWGLITWCAALCFSVALEVLGISYGGLWSHTACI